MKEVIYRTSAIGGADIQPPYPASQVGHFLFHNRELPPRLARRGRLALFIAEIALVEPIRLPGSEIQKTSYQPVIYKRLADVIDRSAFVMAFRIRQEQDALPKEFSRHDIDEHAVWTLPNGMQLSLDKDARHLPKRPACQIAAAVTDRMLWHDEETFIEWLVEQWPAFDDDALAGRYDLIAKRRDMPRIAVWNA